MRLIDLASEKLIRLITVDQKYKAGDKLPNEKELADELGVSRNTLRAAVQQLVGQGVLKIRRGRGTYVASGSDATNPFGFDQIHVTQMKLRDLYELRIMLEPELAATAASRATEEDLATITEIGEKLQHHELEDQDDFEGNHLFHMAIVRASHNEFGIRIFEIIFSTLRELVLAGKISQSIDDFYLDHQLIMDYLKRRDAEGARLAMRMHLLNSVSFYHL
ncbi:MAG: FadR family transcriptional regulator, partial [Clostridia bacterium]|nr:FadR family transcriptional regulator [Eubacterium sp.]MCR4668273.1 FadR family transcriptional regulator [Clostridia bacterium]